MTEERRHELLNVMLEQYHIVKGIKRRCQNATPQDMEHIHIIVRAYNEYTGKKMLKATACGIPHTVSMVQKLLLGTGYLSGNLS